MAGGTLAVVGGTAWIYGTGGWGAWFGGGYLVARGLDSIRTGGLEVWDGFPHETLPQMAGRSLAEAGGANKEAAKQVGERAEDAASIAEIWGLWKAGKAALEALPRAQLPKVKPQIPTPVLTGSTQHEMAVQAQQHLAANKGAGQDALVDLWGRMADQISLRFPNWQAVKETLKDGTVVFAGETRVLVFATDGSIYKANGLEYAHFLITGDWSKLRRL